MRKPNVNGRQSPRRRGQILLFMIVAMPLFVMLCALVVDIARVHLVKTELERTTHAAARYAVNGIQDGTSLDKANWMGQLNPAEGKPVVFAASDVVAGRWDAATQTFSPGAAGGPNAVRVTGRRTVTAGFGQWSGVAAKEVVARATVKYNVLGFGIIGLDSVHMQGNATASYSSSGGGLTGEGNVGSNGNITLGGSTTVYGNTYTGPSKTISGGYVSGTKNTLAAPLSYPNGSAAPYGPNNNDNGSIPNVAMSASSFSLGASKSVTIPGGNYYFNHFSLDGSAILTFTGPATIYCYGNFSMSGRTQTSADKPPNLRLVMVSNPWDGSPPGNVSIGSSAAFHGSIYAPQSAVSIGGSGDVYGSILGKTFSMTGTGRVVYDMALEVNGGTVSLVE